MSDNIAELVAKLNARSESVWDGASQDYGWQPDALCREAAKALTRIAGALEPFAAADRALGDDPGPYRLQTDTGYREISRADFLRAREALRGETK